MQQKIYECICGRTFTTPNSFNGHKRHCTTHLNNVGKLTHIQEVQQKFTVAGKIAAKIKHKQSHIDKTLSMQQWIKEQHTCKKCGKIMTEKFGSGLFCSMRCSNSHEKSIESKIKVTSTLLGRTITEEEYNHIQDKKSEIKHKIKIDTKDIYIPNVDFPQREKGYFSRSKLSYAELFWKQVLDNNNVQYEHDFKVINANRTGVYRLDFLIDGIYDLEIDGEQHRDCVYKDIVRTHYLESLGYKCLRIKWVNPNTDTNKMIVNCQIDQLFKELGKERLV